MTDLLQHKSLIATVIGVVASCAVGLLWLFAPSLLSSWEWSTYDLRLRLRGPAPASPQIVIIGRDAESDARFGVGIWDRALFAKVIEALGQAGAAVIAPDFHFVGASPPERGGTASDEALIKATHTAERVIYPLPLTLAAPGMSDLSQSPDPTLRELLLRDAPALDGKLSGQLPRVSVINAPLRPLVQEAHGIGHMAALPDLDGVYRRVPAYVSLGERAFPAYGVAIAASYLHVPPDHISILPDQAVVFQNAQLPDGTIQAVTLPIDEQGNLLINYAGRWTDGPFPYFSFVDVWDAIEEGDLAALKAQVSGKIVLLLHAAIEADKRRTPLELKAPGGFIHANVLNTILTGSVLKEASVPSQLLVTLALAFLSSWLVLTWPGWKGVGLSAILAVVYVGLTQISLGLGGLVLPSLAPFFALVLASGGSMAWTNLVASHRILRLERDIVAAQTEMATTREALARQESAVERVEEDLEAARAEAAASTEKKQELARYAEELQRQLARAQSQAEATRRGMQGLERKLADLMAAAVEPVRLSSAELERLRQESERAGILTQDTAMLSMFRDLKKAAQSKVSILLLGETGTGKELFARAAHTLSPRGKGPFVAVNASAISSDLVESELFGHVKGAFTGADRDRKGYFEQAHQGTIFLDEIGDLRLEVQAKLLRVLQEGTFYRVGATSPTKVDVRIVAATNKDLLQGIAQGWFREDLYFRLRGIELRLPPLRDRREDLPPLAERFIMKAAAEAGRNDLVLSQGALDALTKHPWPGNVRELQSCLEGAVARSAGNLITEQDLQLKLVERRTMDRAGSVGSDESKRIGIREVSGDAAVLACLRDFRFDMQATAQALGWDRSTVTQRLKGICFSALVEHGGDRRAAAEALAGEPTLAKVVEVKLSGYVDHLRTVAEGYPSAEEAIKALRGRLKNLPDRHLSSVETLVRQYFASQKEVPP